ncbi:uncharacterized protein LODBEIA_P49310 [Lodderomyces beijingensis]|uniref:RING-type domain-containing protein n=1 Tax=Lodderomyces beijingensis TaxID=1775926 RepID=A0ABP0ZRF5_9ASCO
MTDSKSDVFNPIKPSKKGPSSYQKSAMFNKNQQKRNYPRRYDHRNDDEIDVNRFIGFKSYTQTEEYQQNHQKNKRSTRRRTSSPAKKLTAMEYINVNFRFVVDSSKSYKIQEADPNIPINAPDIAAIIAPKSQCPICLTDDIVAPTMSLSCGHIMCLTCLLNMMQQEVPKAKKKESAAVVERYKECPLCSSVIRKAELKPVVFKNMDEQFEIPKVQEEVVLTMMARSSRNILSLPQTLAAQYDSYDFPNTKDEAFVPYSRIVKADVDYVVSFLEDEKKTIIKNNEEEKALYGEIPGVGDALCFIDKEIERWEKKVLDPPAQEDYSETTAEDKTFYFYQTGFNTTCTFVLSSFDMKLLKHNYHTYDSLPTSIVVKIENIKYEELSQETVSSKYKYLGHLPVGSQIAFIECNWQDNDFISPETWSHFKDDLLRRSKLSNKKHSREEANRKRALRDEEVRTRQFYATENGDSSDNDTMHEFTSKMSSISIIDNRPAALSDPEISDGEYQTTVWGTRIKSNKSKPSSSPDDNNRESEEGEELIRRARENESKRSKKSKRLVLMST